MDKRESEPMKIKTCKKGHVYITFLDFCPCCLVEELRSEMTELKRDRDRLLAICEMAITGRTSKIGEGG